MSYQGNPTSFSEDCVFMTRGIDGLRDRLQEVQRCEKYA